MIVILFNMQIAHKSSIFSAKSTNCLRHLFRKRLQSDIGLPMWYDVENSGETVRRTPFSTAVTITRLVSHGPQAAANPPQS